MTPTSNELPSEMNSLSSSREREYPEIVVGGDHMEEIKEYLSRAWWPAQSTHVTQQDINDLLGKTTHLKIKDKGADKGRAIGTKVLFETDDPEKLQSDKQHTLPVAAQAL